MVQHPKALRRLAFVSAALGIGCSASGLPEPPDSERDGTPSVEHTEEMPALPCELPDGERSFDASKSPEARAKVLGCVPDYTDAQLDQAFTAIRDTRALAAPERPDFPRRIPWLLPDNGCEPRANQAAYLLTERGYPTPYYARAVGDLGVATDNDVNGFVRWPGHVAPVVRIGDALWVLDPAVEPAHALPIEEWVARITVTGTPSLALCTRFGLNDPCFPATPALLAPALLESLLTSEWLNLQLLGRDPAEELGACPPWVGCAPADPPGDASGPPVIEQVVNGMLWASELWSGFPIYVLGTNFVAGTTSLRVTGVGVDAVVTPERTLFRRAILPDGLPAGQYTLTAYNGAHASEPVNFTVVD